MPEILRIFGLRFFFFSREHEPIHVHVESADGKAKFNILPDSIVLVYNKGMNKRMYDVPRWFLKKIRNWQFLNGGSILEAQ